MKVSEVREKLGVTWSLVILTVLLNTLYWAVIASDRYVSEANVVLESPAIMPEALNVSAMLSKSNASNDLLLLKDHLLSVDMMQKLDKELGLREHYSSENADFFSRMWSNDAPIEKFHEHYLSRVEAEVDDYAGVLRIRVQAYDPDMANRVANALLKFGEQHMNAMGQKLAMEQVTFIERQVVQLSERLTITRQAVLTYQNKHGLISPTGMVESISAVIAGLENELAQLTAKRNALRNYQSKLSPEIVRLDSQIKAIEQQIYSERNRMATNSGGALNMITAEYEALQLQAQFALDLYSNALSALENTRVEAIRKLKQISVLQKPTYPEYSVEPLRLYNIASYFLVSLLVGLVIQMMLMVIREHRD